MRHPKKPSKPRVQRLVNLHVPPDCGERLTYATTILPAPVSKARVVARGIELYIAEAEKMKENANG